MLLLCVADENRGYDKINIGLQEDYAMQWNVYSDGRCEVKQNTSQRDKKGNSIIAFPDEFVMVDIETTGCDARYNEIIEISAIRIKDDQVIDRFSMLIRPWNDIDPFITNLTGITNQMVQDAPRVGEVIKHFLRFIRPEDIILGYNVNFDINFLYDNALSEADYYLSNNFIDVLRIARKLIKNTENHKLKTIAAYYGISYEGAHRGEQDCIICLECYKRLRDEVDKQSMSEADFIDSFNKRSSNGYFANQIRSKDIVTDKKAFDENHPLFSKVCVFTGALEKMSRKDAMQMVVDLGGICGDQVTRKTNYLVLGNLDYVKSIKDGKSSKMKKAEGYILAGQDIEIISENVFYELISGG